MSNESNSKKNPNEDDLYLNSKKDFFPTKFEDFGYFFFPERFGNVYKPNWFEKFLKFPTSIEAINRIRCEMQVQKAIENHPGVKLLLSAMKSVGCEANLLRHFSCENCDSFVKGGFDPSTNQVITCCNRIKNFGDDAAKSLMPPLIEAFDYCRAKFNSFDLNHLACSKIILCHNRVNEYNDCVEIVSHELVHAFDHCRAHLDTQNNSHVACTEIRAANLTSCTFFDSLNNGASLFSSDKRKECVRIRAALSLQTVRNVSEEEALKAVDSVFDKCYNDLEPFGRRVINKEDCERAYRDRKIFGYE